MIENRRRFLRTLAVGAGVMPAASPLRGWFLPNAHAAAGGGIRRILFVDNQNGVPGRAGAGPNMTGDNGPGYRDFAIYNGAPDKWELGEITKPLAPLKDQVVILDNMEEVGARGDTHFCGLTQLLTGAPPKDPMKAIAGHISIDQYLGEKLGRTVTPKFPNLALGAQSHGMTHTHLADGTPVQGNQDPLDVYRKLTGAIVPGMGSMPDAAVIGRLARRKSVLDYVSKELAEFGKTLGKDDRARADAQLASIRTLENRLSTGMTASTASCGSARTKFEAGWKPGTTAINPRDARLFPEIFQMQMDNIALAFMCDLTRVVSFLPRGRENASFNCPFAPINVADQNIHGLSHNNTKDDFAKFVQAKALMMGWVGALAQKLSAIPEGTGTMLDSTLIFIGTENGRGHTNRGLHFLTIGGKGLGVQTNRYLALGTSRSGGGVPHTRLLTSFLNLMGLPDQTFGDSEATGSGPLKGYQS